MEQNGQRLGVSGQDDELGDTSVEGLGGLVTALLQLAGIFRGVSWLRSNFEDSVETYAGQTGQDPGAPARASDRQGAKLCTISFSEQFFFLGIGLRTSAVRHRDGKSRVRWGIRSWAVCQVS